MRFERPFVLCAIAALATAAGAQDITGNIVITKRLARSLVSRLPSLSMTGVRLWRLAKMLRTIPSRSRNLAS